MGSNITQYFGNKICRWLNNQAAMPSSPSALYIALFNGDPRTGGSEVGNVIDAGSPRHACTFTNISSGNVHTLTSNIAVDFGLSDGDQVFDFVVLTDSATFGAGNLYSAKATNGGPVSVLTGSAVKFNSGDITFNIGFGS